MITGRKPNVEMIRKVKEYRDQGLSFSKINKLTGVNVKILHFWSKYPLEKAIERNLTKGK